MVRDQPLAPNIMRRATKRLAWGRQSSALNPIPRMLPNTGSSLEKSFTRESVNIRPTPLSTRRRWPYRASIADLPISAGDAIISSASSQASRSPRLNPCPATGCKVCAALPTSATRQAVTGVAYLSAIGKPERLPASTNLPRRSPKCSCNRTRKAASSKARIS